MSDPIFRHPRLAHLYDIFDGPRDDLVLYADLASRLEAHSVIDVGCGTGTLARRLAASGYEVIAVDPAEASLDVAKSGPGATRVRWILGTASDLTTMEADLAVMTGNVAQVFLTDEEWVRNLATIRRALRPGGHLVFETRRPEARVWEEWARGTGVVVRDVPGAGRVEQRFALTAVDLPFVSFRFDYRFARDGVTVTSESTLRFRSYDEIVAGLDDQGFDLAGVLDAPDRPGQEYVFVARARPG